MVKIIYEEQWGWLLAAFFFVAAVFVGIGTESVGLALVTMFVAGLIFGRACYRFRRQLKTAIVIIGLGVLLGFWVGTLFGVAFWTALVFGAGAVCSYILHARGWMESVEY